MVANVSPKGRMVNISNWSWRLVCETDSKWRKCFLKRIIIFRQISGEISHAVKFILIIAVSSNLHTLPNANQMFVNLSELKTLLAPSKTTLVLRFNPSRLICHHSALRRATLAFQKIRFRMSNIKTIITCLAQTCSKPAKSAFICIQYDDGFKPYLAIREPRIDSKSRMFQWPGEM